MSRVTDGQPFHYSKAAGDYWTMIGAILVLVSMEGGVIFLLLVNATGRTFQLFVLGVGLVAGLLLAVLLAAPLATKHVLTARDLRLRLGWVELRVPIDEIAAIEPVAEPVSFRIPLNAHYESAPQRVRMNFSRKGVLRLKLRRELDFKTALIGAPVPVREIVFDALQWKRLLAALGPVGEGVSPVEPPPSHLPRTERRPPASGVAGIECKGLDFAYGQKEVLKNLDLAVCEGEIYGLLGANGAGKTTTLRLLSGLLTQKRGQIVLGGHDLSTHPLQAKALLGVMTSDAVLFDRLTGREYLQYLAALRSLPLSESEERIEELLSLMELSSVADDLCQGYSLGTGRKLILASALLHEPEILLFDEPLNGLDPTSRYRVKRLLRTLSEQGVTILFSTHEFSPVRELCDRVGILANGHLVAEGAPQEFGQSESELEAFFLKLAAPSAGSS